MTNFHCKEIPPKSNTEHACSPSVLLDSVYKIGINYKLLTTSIFKRM